MDRRTFLKVAGFGTAGVWTSALARTEEARDLQRELDQRLQSRLVAIEDEFLPGEEYVPRWGYELDPVKHDTPVKL